MHLKESITESNRTASNWFPTSGRDVIEMSLLLFAYFVSARFDLKLMHLQPLAGVIWIPAGISLAAVLLRGQRVALAIFIGALLFNLSAGVPFKGSLAIACGNTAEALIGGYLVSQFAGGTKSFSRPQHVLKFTFLAGILATFFSAVVGTVVAYGLKPMSHSEITAIFVGWWVSNALGILVLTPFLVLLLDGSHKAMEPAETMETAALLIGLSMVCVFTFGPLTPRSSQEVMLGFLCVPFLLWAGIRFCPLEASGACLVLSGFATWGSLHGHGPFAPGVSNPLTLAAFLSVASTMTLIGSSSVAGQRRTSEELLESLFYLQQTRDSEIERLQSELELSRDELIRRLHYRSVSDLERRWAAVHHNQNEVLWFLEAESENTIYVSPSYETVWGRSREDLFKDPHAWMDAVHPEDRQYAIMFVGQDFPGDRVETTYRIQRPDGSIRWIYDRGFVIRDAFGRPSRLLGLASDITELVEHQTIFPAHMDRRPAVLLRERAADTMLRREK